MDGASELRWARRVKPEKIRRLYALDAKGVVDEDLIDDVGYAMLARCESIRAATRAVFGKATCPRCKAPVMRRDPDWNTWRKDEPLVCDCGWATTWGAYQRSYRRKQLVGGKAYPAFRAFIDRWPACRTPRDKMLAIDWLIHVCHVDAKHGWARPAACQVIEGTMGEMIPFLDALAYGPQSTSGVADEARAWAMQPQLNAWRAWKRGESDRMWIGADDDSVDV
jgi:hypothetical protein